ncbi:ATP-binding response regulator [Actibacterium lipolyticum]
MLSLGLLASGTTLVVMVGVLWGTSRSTRKVATATVALARAFSEKDAAPGVATNELGQVTYQNPAALKRFGAETNETLIRALGELFANPAGVVHRLQSRAQAQGGALEDVVTRRGHVRVSVHTLKGGAFFWRFDELDDRGGGRGAEGLSLPMLTVGRNGTILFMNDAARTFAGGRVKSLGQVFTNLPIRSGGINEVKGRSGAKSARVVEIENKAGRREVYFFPIDMADENSALGDQFFDALPVALLKLQPNGQVTMSNRLARGLLGHGPGEIQFPDLVEGLGRSVLDWLAEVSEGRAVRRAEVLRVKRDDKEVFLQVSLEKNPECGEGELIAVLHDATELKTLEAQFVQSQKMQAIGQLAGGVAHDFNNLLTAISGHCDLLLLRHDQGDPDFGDLMQINQNANRAASLVGQLLAFSRKQTLRPEVVDLRDTLTDLTHLLNRLVGERVQLTVSHDPNLGQIRADKRQLEQVIMNLVVNARDAMPDGGEIRIETGMHHLTEPLRRDRAVVSPGHYVLVRVIDEGTGIAPDKLSKIFEPFFTTKGVGEGTGLGLSTAYGIVKQTGGFIFVDSAQGSGTCFTLYFPMHEFGTAPEAVEAGFESVPAQVDKVLAPVAMVKDSAQQGSRSDVATRPDNQMTDGFRQGEGVVLLVEDEAPVRAFASRALRMRGFTVLEAENAEQALEALEDSKIAVDVFVTDVVMPGMDGPSWVRKALETRPDTRVVFVSGYAEDSFSDTQARIPNSVFLPKPFSLNELTTTVREQIP